MAFFDSSISKVHLGAIDLSPYTTAVNGLPGPRALNPVTTLADAGAKRLPTIQDVSPSVSGLWDEATLDPEVGALRTGSSLTLPISYWPAGLTVGAAGYAARVLANDYQIGSQVGSVVEFTVPMLAHGVAARIKSLIGAKTTDVANANKASIDDLAGSSNGGTFWLHVFAVTATGGNAQWIVDLEDSTDDAAFADFATVTVADAATGGTYVSVAGTFNRYVRVQLTLDATSGSITWHAGYERN